MSKLSSILRQNKRSIPQRLLSTSLVNFHTPDDEKITKKDFKDFKKTPIGKLDEIAGQHPYAEKEPLPEWENGVNPHTGEIGGPKGVEPTRYGDWERKGRVTDF